MHHLTAPVEFVQSAPVDLPLDFYERLCAFYQRQPEPDLSPIWKGCHAYVGELSDALSIGNAGTVQDYLHRLYHWHAVNGIDWDAGMYEREPETCQREFERVAFALAESLEVVRAFNPEQPAAEEWAADVLLAACEQRLGVELNHRGGGGMVGARVGTRFVPLKLLYQAVTLATMRRLPWKGSALEIGAGCGFLGYLARQAPGASDYHTVDLPLVSVIQAYLWACAERPDWVWLNGEPSSWRQHRFNVHGLRWPEGRRFGLFVNQDSLPEMTEPEAYGHIREMTASAGAGAFFLSVNHESPHGEQRPVRSLMGKVLDWTLRQRSPYWGRAGYVEEIWERQ